MIRWHHKTLNLFISIFIIFTIQSCSCTQKYSDLQNRYTEIHEQKRVEKDSYSRELKQKDDQIAELLRHIKNLESQIQKLENK